MVRRKPWIMAGLIVIVLFVIACGDSATATLVPTALTTPRPTSTPTPTPSPTAVPVALATDSDDLNAAEAEYIVQVRAGWNKFHSKAGGFRQVFGQTYSTRSRLFEALIDAGAGSAFEGAYQAVEQIKPPPRFQADHDLMLQEMAKMVGYDYDVGRAAENQDLAGFTVANARMGVTGGLMGLQLSDALCPATTPPDLPFSFCNPGRTLPGGEYGVELNDSLARLTIGVVLRMSPIGLHYTPEDAIGALAELRPEIIDQWAKARDEISGFDPPGNLIADHDRLVQYLEAQREATGLQISAVQEQDLAKYQEENARSLDLYCEARQVFASGEMREIVRVHFVDVFRQCGSLEY